MTLILLWGIDIISQVPTHPHIERGARTHIIPHGARLNWTQKRSDGGPEEDLWHHLVRHVRCQSVNTYAWNLGGSDPKNTTTTIRK